MDANDLYGLPLERFVPERTAVAKGLREQGRREEAAAVAALRKPSVAAWAVNQLVRTQSRAVAELYEAGDALQQAQSELVSGRGDARALRDSTARERAAVSDLVQKARGLLSTEGHELTPAMLDRVSDTLHAAALDEEVRAEVRHGCLHKELRHVGLGSVGRAAPAARAGARAGSKAAAPQASRATKRDDAGRAKRLAAARKAESTARRAADRAARELETAQGHRDQLARSLREAEDALAAARERAKDAERKHRRARQGLDGL